MNGALIASIATGRIFPARSRLPLLAAGLAAAALLSGCLGTVQIEQRHGRGSAMDFLYPPQGGEPVYKTPEIPATLRLPMRVGLAFAPDAGGNLSTMPDPTQGQILDAIGKQVATYPFVQSVAVIPHVYLQRGGGFQNLRQIQTAFGVDIIGLVSYDQIANTSENPASILYITLVGRYFIPGDKHEVKTLIDVLLLDPKSETLLMRAAGTSSLAGLSADAFAADRTSTLSREGYEKAVPPLLAEADLRLAELRQDIESGRRKDVKVEVRPGYDAPKMGVGSGAGGPLEVAGLMVLALAAVVLRRRGDA